MRMIAEYSTDFYRSPKLKSVVFTKEVLVHPGIIDETLKNLYQRDDIEINYISSYDIMYNDVGFNLIYEDKVLTIKNESYSDDYKEEILEALLKVTNLVDKERSNIQSTNSFINKVKRNNDAN